jgi:hypothetical protein
MTVDDRSDSNLGTNDRSRMTGTDGAGATVGATGFESATARL